MPPKKKFRLTRTKQHGDESLKQGAEESVHSSRKLPDFNKLFNGGSGDAVNEGTSGLKRFRKHQDGDELPSATPSDDPTDHDSSLKLASAVILLELSIPSTTPSDVLPGQDSSLKTAPAVNLPNLSLPSATSLDDLPGHVTLLKRVKDVFINNKLNIYDFTVDGRKKECLKFLILCQNDSIEFEKGLVLKETCIDLYVHGLELPKDNKYVMQANNCKNVKSFENFLYTFQTTNVCLGNYEADYINAVPEGKGISFKGSNTIDAFKHACFQQDSGVTFLSTIRSSKCLLLFNGKRCAECRKVRRALLNRIHRKSNASNNDVSSYTPNMFLSTPEKLSKLNKLASENKVLNRKVASLQGKIHEYERKYNDSISKSGETVSDLDNFEINQLVQQCQGEVEPEFEQELFLEFVL